MDSKISALEAVSLVGDTDVLPIVNGGVTKKVSVSLLRGTSGVPYTGATQDLNLGEFGLQTGNIEFDLTPTTPPTNVGSLVWNDLAGTLDLKLKGGAVTLQIGQETVARIVNKTATNITLLESNYQAVRVTGAQGQRPKVDLAQANNDLNSTTTLGLVTETILNNAEGFITTSGQVQEINTTGSLQGETWADGDILYLSGTVAGRITNIKPIAPIHTVIIGFVEYAHINQGKIFVKVDNGYELDELHNVSAIAPNNNEVLTYDTPTLLWRPKTVATVLGYTPENELNKTNTIAGNETSLIKYPSVKGIFDWATNLFATKLMSAYSIRVNNTALAANAQEVIYKSFGQQIYTGTIIWTGTTAPSGDTNFSYNWIQIGNQVTLTINLLYSVAGASLTAVQMPLPLDCPAPINPTGYGINGNDNIYIGSGILNISVSSLASATGRTVMRRNSANTANVINITMGGGGYASALSTIQYFTS